MNRKEELEKLIIIHKLEILEEMIKLVQFGLRNEEELAKVRKHLDLIQKIREVLENDLEAAKLLLEEAKRQIDGK